MNTSQPVSSAIESVDFEFLTQREIKSISVKQITRTQALDDLRNPNEGGLYDTALGAWGEFSCTTCNLGPSSCPGHAGHIDLPIPVYHAVFMDQILRLLRAQCAYCFRFRIPRAEISLFLCKFRLLQFGLVHETNEIDNVSYDDKGSAEFSAIEDSEHKYSTTDTIRMLTRMREHYTEAAIGKHGRTSAEVRQGKHEGAYDMRRDLVKTFLRDVLKPKTCASCNAISPTYRKDGFAKIFEKPLTGKQAERMAQTDLRRPDALSLRQQNAKKVAKDVRNGTKKKYRPVDEGIADVDMSPSEESDDVEGHDEQDEDEEGETESDDQGEELGENGDIIMGESNPKKKTKSKAKEKPVHRFISSLDVLARLSLLFENEQEILRALYNSKPQTQHSKPVTADSFFLQCVLVPPNKFRPDGKQPDGGIAEAEQNKLYSKILEACGKIAQINHELAHPEENEEQNRRRRVFDELHEASIELQHAVNSLIDRDRNPVRGNAGKRNEEGIKQKLEKKEGLFRKNMMGKRVNFAARSVISPDPNIETSEIGVPPVFAKKLTFPEPVTSHNFRELQQAVINGPYKWPGAVAIENENGSIINLAKKGSEDRVALANQLLAPSNPKQAVTNGKKVLRHLGNGDVVLMNRQPTLHKPSIMGHRVRVLPGEKTIRMHYANCNTYNADFDGDEMNMHFPQNELARAEALQIADTDHQYLSGTAGKPLRGLIQDHLSVSVALCNKDTFFDKGAYQQLVYNALRPEHGHITTDRLVLVPPAILKPIQRWTGKQVVTTILKNIQPIGFGELWSSGKTSVPADRWDFESMEGSVLVHDNEFCHGILDKAHLGPSSGGFIHSVHETWGATTAARLLSCMGRLLTRYLNMRAFTCGMDDLRLTPQGESKRLEALKAASGAGLKTAAKFVSLDQQRSIGPSDPVLLERLEAVMRNDNEQADLDVLMNAACSDVSTAVTLACLPDGLEKQFPKNQMQSMTTSGAKGSKVNANLISCNLGQQVLEGRRVPLMVSGKSLPCFRPFETNVRAGGYIVNRFLTGIRPQEYYFHHMAGREGLIDTAVKTSRSGYLQRCLIKGMEGLKVAYDTTVRDSDGTMIQFLYGEDGLDVTKQNYLRDFSFLLRNRDSEVAQLGIAQRGWDKDTIHDSREYAQGYNRMALKEVNANNPKARDPITADLNPNRNAFATSETFYERVSNYLRKNPDLLLRVKATKNKPGIDGVSRKVAEILFHTKYLASLVEPGEAVGIVAGQSVGEPSTQMTLNTFHLAGHSAKNVTLGIPRLREILMTASDHISTPSMTLVLREDLSEAGARDFTKAISKLLLASVTDYVTVRERVGKGIGYSLAKTHDVRLQFFDAKEYEETYAVSTSDVFRAVETTFLAILERLVGREIKKRAQGQKSAARPDVGTKSGNVEMARPDGEGGARGDDDDGADEDEDDATGARNKARRAEAVSYGPNDDDDEAVQGRLAREASPDEDDDDNASQGGSPSDSDEDEDEDKNHKHRKISKAAAGTNEREVRVQELHDTVVRFSCDEQGGSWCEFSLEHDATTPKLLMLSLVQQAVRHTVVQQIEGLNECTYVPQETVKNLRTGEKEKRAVLHTKGVNLAAMQEQDAFIDPHRTQTNDIAAVLRVYGVEAARRTIMLELDGVFGGHGISVDNRHLNLISDYMTRGGGFTPFNRNGLRGNVSPFLKASFETTLAVLKDAVMDGDWDDLNSASSRIVMGKLGSVGTGSFDVLTRVTRGAAER